MAKYGRGLICMPMLGERLDELQISMMVSDNTAPLGTAFTVSVDARRGVTTGTSAYDRAVTIRTLVDPATRAEDLTRPGHIFPLRAMPGGVLRRAGHTEAAIDLARLAGFAPAGVICEVLDEEGGMARLPELMALGREYQLKMITIKALIEYRIHKEKLVRRAATTRMPTEYGEFTASSPTRRRWTTALPLALVMGDVTGDEPCWCACTRSASPATSSARCRCDCGSQLHKALRHHPARGPRRPRLHAPGRPRHRPAQQAPRLRASGCRARTPSRPTTRSASAPTCATTASGRRSCVDLGRQEPPDPHQQPEEDRRASRATASRWSSGCRSRCRRTDANRSYLRTKREKLGPPLLVASRLPMAGSAPQAPTSPEPPPAGSASPWSWPASTRPISKKLLDGRARRARRPRR